MFVATVIGVVGIGRHRNHEARDDAQSREADVKMGPRVRVATVKQAPGIRHLSLQGEARPFFEVTLYAKVAGFLSDLKVDKGDRVKKNQLIAKVTAPELDAQYTAAVADARNKRVNAKRLTALAPAGVVSAQELELGQASGRRGRRDPVGDRHPARLPGDPRAVRRRHQRALRRSGHAHPERRQRPERGRPHRLGLQGGPAARLRLRRPVERAVRPRRRRRRRHRPRAPRLVAPGQDRAHERPAVAANAHHADRGRHQQRRPPDRPRQLRPGDAGRAHPPAARDAGRGAGHPRRQAAGGDRRRHRARSLQAGGRRQRRRPGRPPGQRRRPQHPRRSRSRQQRPGRQPGPGRRGEAARRRTAAEVAVYRVERGPASPVGAHRGGVGPFEGPTVIDSRRRARGARGCPPRRSGRRRESRSSTGCARRR